MKRKLTVMAMTAALATAILAGCGNSTSSEQADTPASAEAATDGAAGSAAEGETEGTAAMTGDISVLTREDGSGTRGAFIELMGIEVKNEDGEKEDMTTPDAGVTNSTEVMLSTVAGNPQAIGYVSLGSLNDTVKSVQIEGVDATAENVASGTYTVSRPFNIATLDTLSDSAQDFIDYILSAEGQTVIEENGYIAINDSAESYSGSGATEKIVVGGSSSVSPVMEKLIEAYKAVNANVEIELQTSDSTTGMTGAADGTLDIGMASRELKDSETEAGLTATKIAMDGIAVIVNLDNPTEDLSSEAVKSIFTGETTTWDAVQ